MKIATVASIVVSALAWASTTHALPQHMRNAAKRATPEPSSLLGRRYVTRPARDIPALAKTPQDGDISFLQDTNGVNRNGGDRRHKPAKLASRPPVPMHAVRQGRDVRLKKMLSGRSAKGGSRRKNETAAATSDVDDGDAGATEGNNFLSKQGAAPSPVNAAPTNTSTTSVEAPTTSITSAVPSKASPVTKNKKKAKEVGKKLHKAKDKSNSTVPALD